MFQLLIIILLSLLAWFWWDTRWAEEIATQVAKRLCDNANVQFLDDTVSRVKFSSRRNQHGTIQLIRHYEFEFSPHGTERYCGTIIMQGRVVLSAELQPYAD